MQKQFKIIHLFMPKPDWFCKFMTIVITYTGFVWWFDDHYFPKQQILEAHQIMAATSIVIGLLLAFRTNSAYDRWWEGRKLWGQLVNDIRNLAIKAGVYLQADAEENEKVGRLLIAFPLALRWHLRGQPPEEKVTMLVPGFKPSDHLPLNLSKLIYSEIDKFNEKSSVDGFHMLLVDPHVRALMDICGACERILRSPIAGTYKCLIWVWLCGYLLVIPWLLVPTFDVWTLPLIFIGTYFLIAVEFLAEEVEEPFGLDPNDLPLDAICQTIEKSVCQVTGCLPYSEWSQP